MTNFMPTHLLEQTRNRKAAEHAIIDFLRTRHGEAVRMCDIYGVIPAFDKGTARRAVLRLAAKGDAVLDGKLNVLLAKAA